MTLHQHGLDRSVMRHLRERMGEGVQVDLHFDGYEMPSTRPLILIEQMQSNFEYISKGRESVESIYRYQIGLYDTNGISLSKNQERLQRIFNFDTFTFYNTFESPWTSEGSFMCELMAIVPMPADDISQKSDYNRIYFDVEITDIKRRC